MLAPAIELADGFPIEAQLANTIEARREMLKQWPYSKALFLPNLKESNAPVPAPVPAGGGRAYP